METKVKASKTKDIINVKTQKIIPFLWFDNQAEEAVKFYTSVFKNSKTGKITYYGEAGAKIAGRKPGSVMTVSFHLDNQEFQALNGGPMFEITPAISFFVDCKSADEIENLWSHLSEGGTTLMQLDKYPFSPRFGWLKDKFGVTWQMNLSGAEQKIAPFLLFTGEQSGKAGEAIHFYTSIFQNSSILQIERFSKGEPTGIEGTIKHAKFKLGNQEFMAMDGGINHAFTFTPGFSLLVNCEAQNEIDFFWDKLTEGGDVNAQQCGWLQDKYGVSWQIVSGVWEEMIAHASPKQSEKIMEALFQMKKIDIAVLQRAYEESA